MIIMSLYDNPIKKRNHYICNLKEKVSLNLSNVTILNNLFINDSKSLLKVRINNNVDIETLNNIDIMARNTMIENNKVWFNNNMTEERIIEKFNPSFDIQSGILSLYIYTEHPPKIVDDNITRNNIDTIESIVFEMNNIVNIDIRLLGLYISQDTFGVKWMIKRVDIIPLNESIVGDDKEIEDSWENEIEELESMIDNKIMRLSTKKEEMKELLNKCKNKECKWENIRKYVNSFLSDVVNK